MGIKNLTTILKEKNKNISKEIELSNLNGKIIAIDMLTFVYKYIRSVGDDVNWINIIALFFYKLYKHNIKGICIFDGGDIPLDKLNKRKERLFNVQKTKEKYLEVKYIKDLLSIEITNNNVTMTPENIKNSLLK